ncbi:MAG: type 1 glutamine amidotransferase [Endomicrobium sp.]|jgi:GMP synthase (glutamine-hydrolysing)|nr:type 1 glutamine amidotransferase [Endomicrobium sp.]
MSLKIHCFKHVPFEDLGCIKNWIDAKGHSLSYTEFYKNHSLPKQNEYDWLIVMGGPMGVYEEDKYTWLASEKAFIKQALQNNKTIIGICLGAQLIADVLGAKVYKNKEKEIGWLPIETLKNKPLFSEVSELNGNPALTVFQWHGDTFDLPGGAKLLASSDACKNQAFLYKNNVLAIQFHFEVTKESAKSMALNCKNEIIPAKYSQTLEEILNNDKHISKNNLLMFNILDALLLTH